MGTLLCIYVDTLSLSRWMPTVRNAGQPLGATFSLVRTDVVGKSIREAAENIREAFLFRAHTSTQGTLSDSPERTLNDGILTDLNMKYELMHSVVTKQCRSISKINID